MSSCNCPARFASFLEALGIPASQVLGKLLQLGTLSNINAELDPELAELLAAEFGIEVDFKQPADPEEELAAQFEQEDDPETLQPRPPVVTFLGHVDHGKTSLLDRIIGTRVVAGEAGGITQHIRAYRVEKDGRAIAFVDTPGHEAFTEMRARGANVTDIAVLVVAADDGVMPQTEEAINHARAAGVPIVVALNKIDLPGTDINRIMQQLAANELLPVEWGGETELVKCSALTGEGVDDLLETLLTIAELHEYKANPNRPPSAPAWKPSGTRAAAWWPRYWCRRARSRWATWWFVVRLTAA
jgi:bacterial translation initiation factor 2 (bIF-2)